MDRLVDLVLRSLESGFAGRAGQSGYFTYEPFRSSRGLWLYMVIGYDDKQRVKRGWGEPLPGLGCDLGRPTADRFQAQEYGSVPP